MDDGLELGAASREERLTRNEVFFRSVNERIEQQAIRFGGLDHYDFICECSSSECVERVSLSLIEYERVRAEGARFFVAPGHSNIEVEIVADSSPRYDTVEKDGAAGIAAEFSDPRDGAPEVHAH